VPGGWVTGGWVPGGAPALLPVPSAYLPRSSRHLLPCLPTPFCPPSLLPAPAVADRLPVRELVTTLDPLLTPFLNPFVGE